MREMDRTPSVLSLAWLSIALRAHGRAGVEPARFEALFASSARSAGSAWHRAMALLAVSSMERSPFVIGGDHAD
jgi:hypothetical protein